MRVWQPGGHLMADRGSKVDDWSWRRTRRRLATLARLAAPYKTRMILPVFALLAATATALAPPFLSKYAVDYGIRKQDLQALSWIVAIFLLAGLANWGLSYAQTYLTGWVGERILAEPRGRVHQPADARRGGARPALDRRLHVPRAEHADTLGLGDPPVRARLAA